MLELVGFVIWIAAFAIGIFALVVMVAVYQAAIAAKEYFERENRNYNGRPIGSR